MWRQYWDYQLYKALEYQYTQGLECINKTLPEVEVKMVFRQHKLQVGVGRRVWIQGVLPRGSRS